MALTTLFQSSLNNASIVLCACKAAQYILPNIPTDIQHILVERLHTAIIRCISKYYSANQEICCDLLRHVLPQLWKMNSSLCENAISDKAFVELLTTKLSVLVQDENHIHVVLPYAMLLSNHIEYWRSIIPDLELAGVHRTIRAIFRSYNLLSVEELFGILNLLCVFVDQGTHNAISMTHVDQYISENMYAYLIILVEHFLSNLTIQELAWKLMKLLCHIDKQFARVLLDSGLLRCANSLLMEQNSMEVKQYTIEFLAIVFRTVGELKVSSFQVPGFIESVARLIKNDTLEERYVLISSYIIIKLTTEMSIPLLSEILNSDVLMTLKERALQCPEKYITPFCETFGNIISCNRRIGFDASQLLNKALQSHHHFYQNVFSNESVTSNSHLTTIILQSLYKVVNTFPLDLFEKTVGTKPFIEPLFSLLQTYDDSKIICLITSLLRVVCRRLCGCDNGPKIVYECNAHVALAQAFTKSLTMAIAKELLGLFWCLFQLYNRSKKTTALIDVSLHVAVVNVAKKFGHFQCQELANEYRCCVLTISADKEFSKKLISLNYMDNFIPLISETYCGLIVEGSLIALGNLAINGIAVKDKLINEHRLHLQLASYIQEHTIDGNANVLSACCSLLNILASDDLTREMFNNNGYIEILLKLLKLRKDNLEICEHSVRALSSLSYTAICFRKPLIRHAIIEILCGIIRGSSTYKAKFCASEILMCICEREDGVCLVRNTGIMEDMINMAAACHKNWWRSIVEKLSLYTVVLPDMPGDQQKDILDGKLQEISHVIKGNGDFLSHGTDNLQHRSPKLDPRIKALIAIEMPDNAFCIGRLFGSTFCVCSNCERNDIWAEFIMRVHDMSPMQYQHLINNGWYRRGGIEMCRLKEHHSIKCCNWEARIDALKFDHTTTKSYRKVLRKMPSNINIKTLPAYFNKEAFDLYNSYHVSKHKKSISSEHTYAEHVVYSPYRQQEGKGGIVYGTYHQEYYLGDRLAAVGVIDVVPYGVVSVYMWYDNSKEINKYSFGVYSVLKEIEYVRSLATRNSDIKYYYLQGWNPHNKKLSYKANYTPVEFFCPCISTEWIPNISGVSDCIENKLQAREVTRKESVPNDNISSVPSTNLALVNAYDVGITPYETHCGPIDINTIPVCLDLTQFNNADTHSFLTLGEVFVLYQIKEYQVEIMKERFKELIVALGQPLAKEFYIVLKVCQQANV